ncbi:hypothetical protein HanPSC8_Chr08g0318311 [Helianthus annuus]|nr:hypothetical protein HanPSC8_Chr08g0318311 [Helianthus annuus]
MGDQGLCLQRNRTLGFVDNLQLWANGIQQNLETNLQHKAFLYSS